MARWKTKDPFPRGPLMACGAAVCLALLSASFTSITGVGQHKLVLPTAVEQRDLIFADRADGAIVITEPGNVGEPVRVVQPGTDGFIRVAVRGLAFERERHGVGSAAPFRLMRTADDRMWLIDPETNGKVEVSAFGPGNRNVFAQLFASHVSNQPRKATP